MNSKIPNGSDTFGLYFGKYDIHTYLIGTSCIPVVGVKLGKTNVSYPKGKVKVVTNSVLPVTVTSSLPLTVTV